MKRTTFPAVALAAALLMLAFVSGSARAAAGVSLRGTDDSDIGWGTEGNDTIKLLDGNDAMFGMGGNDKLDAGPAPSRNWIFLGAGKDTAIGGNTLDLIIDEDGTPGDNISSHKGTDFIVSFDGAKDFINCGSNFDKVIVDPQDSLYKCENVITVTTGNMMLGTTGNDILNGGTDSDFIFGGPGNDTINGGDETTINTGDYLLLGGPGVDTINGGKGDDILIDDDGTPGDTIDAGEGDDFIFTADGEQDTIICGPGNDKIIGDYFDVAGPSAQCEAGPSDVGDIFPSPYAL